VLYLCSTALTGCLVALNLWFELPPSSDSVVSRPAAENLVAFRDGFETSTIAWQREHTDTTIHLIAHERSARAAHEGELSERFFFDAEEGSQFFVSYALPRIPVTADLEVALWVRSTRVGIQLLARVVLPADVDPDSRAPSFVMIPGPIYDRVDRWQRLEMSQMLPLIERQARVLRASSKRKVSLEGAYLERLVVNLMGGAGETEVFLDDLSISPVTPELATPPVGTPPDSEPQPKADTREPLPPVVALKRNRLQRRGADRQLRDFLPTAIDAPGADVGRLRRYGFDILVEDADADRSRLQAAVEQGFLLMPRLLAVGSAADIEAALEAVEKFPEKEAVAFWILGEGLGRKRGRNSRNEELRLTRELVNRIRGSGNGGSSSRLTTAMVEDELPLYARAPANLDAIGIRPIHWASAQDCLETLAFLNQRRRLTVRSNADGLFWAWIPVAAPPLVRTNIWGHEVPPSWGVPQVLPEQLRLMTYMALSAGYRGLGYLADADLTRPAARAQLIELAFLNEEIDLFESVLARGSDPIPVYHAYDSDPPDLPPPGMPLRMRVRPQREFGPKPGLLASAISVGRKGALLLLADYAANAQYQPPQMAAHNLTIRAVLPEGAQIFEISPGEVKVIENRNRVPGGTQFTLPDFSTTALLLCTTDLTLKDQIETVIHRVRPVAVQLAIEQAELMLRFVSEINGRLAADGQSLIGPEELKRRAEAGITTPAADERDLLARAEATIQTAREAQEREDFALAWAEARRASRPLRILMHGHWVKGFNSLVRAVNASYPNPPTGTATPLLIKPIACPPALAFNTLPELYVWLDWIAGKQGYRFGENRLPEGDFDDPRTLTERGWVSVGHETEGIRASTATVPRDGDLSDRMIRMSVEPEPGRDLDTELPPFLDFPPAAIRTPPIPVQAKNLIRISVLVKRPVASVPGMGGVIVRDSIGGEQLQFRTSDPIPRFSRVVLFRKAPSDGSFTVTLGLAGYGEAFFDDLRVELIESEDVGPRRPPNSEFATRRPGTEPGAQPPLPSAPPPPAVSGTAAPRRRS
jgi:hypothetical protein